MSLLRDEQGSKSAMRTALFFFVLPALLGITIVEIWHPFQATVWTTWGQVTVLFIVGCFGPRMMQYVGPQLGALAGAIGQAKRDARLPSKHDDERGDAQ